MKLLLIFPVLIGAYVLWQFSKKKQKNKEKVQTFFDAIAPLAEALEDGKTPDPKLINALCTDHAQRLFVWMLLDTRNRLDLFPKQYKDHKYGAMSNLCYWLTDSDQLAAQPDHIEFVEKISFPTPDSKVEADYYVFKFNMEAPHWLSKSGWRIGVSGPYLPDTPLYASVAGTYSRFDPIGEKDIEAHARWVHEEMVVKKGIFEQ